MTILIIITLCSLLLAAYLFDYTSSKTKIPSVILLLALGWVLKEVSRLLDIQVLDFSSILPILGTIGLVLIVLEGSLELELKRSKIRLIGKSFLGAIAPLVILSLSLALVFHVISGSSYINSLVNVIPLFVISSAIAIPSVEHFSSRDREFVIYESSLSDILGVLFFNFFALNEFLNFASFGSFTLELVIIILISFIATIGLALLLKRLDHRIKFFPIILLVILIYAISKYFHLPGLLFILLFGLFIGNLDEIKNFAWIKRLNPDQLDKEVHRFKEFNIEATFIIRSLFFLVFGYLVETSDLLNTEMLIWSSGIVICIFTLRFAQLKLSKLPIKPLLFIAPRGLITILLFLSIQPSQRIPLIDNAMIVQVIILTTFIMMFGGLISERKSSLNNY